MKTKTLSVRVDAELVDRIEKFERDTGVEKAVLVRSAIHAVLDFQEAHGFISFPIEIVPKERKKPH